MNVAELKYYAPYYEEMYKQLPQDVSMLSLLSDRYKFLDFYDNIPEDKWDYRYEEGKWSIKKIVRHIVDAELIFNYRALSIVRGEKKPLMGWSENEYAEQVDDILLNKDSLLKSLNLQFQYTADLFSNFAKEDLKKIGNANGYDTEVAAIGFSILAHEMHHRNAILQLYL